MADFYRQVSRALKQSGWYYDHAGKGDHEIWRNGVGEGSWSVSVPRKLRKLPTAESVLKQAGLDKSLLKQGRTRRRTAPGVDHPRANVGPRQSRTANPCEDRRSR